MNNYQNLPAELRQNGLFCLWRREDQKGRLTKVPYKTNGYRARSTEKADFVNFETAMRYVKNYNGIGLGIFDGYCAVDIDHCVTDGVLSDLANEIVNTFNSYTEYSPSGEGVRIIFKAQGVEYDKQRYYINNHKLGLEIYVSGCTSKYVTLTGNVIKNLPVRDCSTELQLVLDYYMKKGEDKSKKPESKPPASTCYLTDDEVITKALNAKNGDKFRRLWSGDFDSSHSEADLALCSHLAFWCGGDTAQMDRLFRSSALYRDKWERDDYREQTLRTAVRGCREFYSKTSAEDDFSKGNKPYFIAFSDKGPVVKPALLAKWTREHLDYLLVRDSGKQGVLIYVYENGVYKLYAPDMLKGIIKGYIADYSEELVKMNNVNEAFNQLMTDTNYISQSELNADENIINFKNGLLSLKDNEPKLLPHTPDCYSTIQIPCEWSDRSVQTPIFDRYLDTLTDKDEDIRTLLLQFIGVCLSNIKGYRTKKSLFLVGSGDTGKSQLKGLVERLLGEGNFIGIDLSEIEARFGTGAIYGTRLAGSSDMSFMSVSELKTFKKLTGGDSVFAEFKGQQGFQYTYNGLLWFCMNRLPKFGGDDGQWVYNRIMVVNCPNVIKKENQDRKLLDKMFREREGIVYKAVMALKDVIENGYQFSEPECVSLARQQYRSLNNSVISFADECLCPWPNGKINQKCTTGKIYKVYQAYCKENNNGYAKTAREFREELADYFGTTFDEMTVKRQGNNYYKELSLTYEAKVQFEKEYGYDADADFLN